MNDFERLLSSEERRAQMLGLLRESKMGLLSAINADGNLVTMFFGANSLELLGLRDKMCDHVDLFDSENPEFIEEEDPDDLD